MHEQKKMGRPRTFDQNKVLTTIMNLFWEKGYEGTYISDIVAATSVKKGSLYKLFGSKHDMYIQALLHYEIKEIDSGCQYLRGSNPPIERIERMLSWPAVSVFEKNDLRGCFLCNASADQSALNAEIRDVVNAMFRKFEKAALSVINEIFPKSTAKDNLAKARFVVATYSGLRVISRSSTDKQQLNDIKKMAMRGLIK